MTSRADFVGRFAQLWLIRELDDDELGDWRSVTQAASIDKPPVRSKTRQKIRSTLKLSRRLPKAPAFFGLHEIGKTDVDSGKNLVTIGRAASNEIVVQDQSVSKVHACFVRTGTGAWAVQDLGSSNGSTIDGKPMAAGVAAIEVQTGSVLVLGALMFEVIPSPDLYDLLSPGG